MPGPCWQRKAISPFPPDDPCRTSTGAADLVSLRGAVSDHAVWKSPSDSCPCSRPCQAISLIFHCALCCFSLELSVFSVNCEGSCCLYHIHLWLTDCFLSPRRALKGRRSDFIYRLLVPKWVHTDLFWIYIFSFFLSSLCAHECTLCLLKAVRTSRKVSELLTDDESKVPCQIQWSYSTCVWSDCLVNLPTRRRLFE